MKQIGRDILCWLIIALSFGAVIGIGAWQTLDPTVPATCRVVVTGYSTVNGVSLPDYRSDCATPTPGEEQ